jgi:DNA-binding transcriptional regulator LsrR (DeoR family)
MPLTSDVVSRWKQASIIVSGVGSIDPKATSLALWKTSGLVPERDLPLLEQELEMVGDLSLHFFTKEGKLFPKHDDHKNSKDVAEVIRKLAYPVSASLKHLHDAATDQNRLSLAVGAGKAKAKPLFWAVINRFVSGLVIDEEAAEEMLQLHKQWLQELELRAQEIVTSAAAA